MDHELENRNGVRKTFLIKICIKTIFLVYDLKDANKLRFIFLRHFLLIINTAPLILGEKSFQNSLAYLEWQNFYYKISWPTTILFESCRVLLFPLLLLLLLFSVPLHISIRCFQTKKIDEKGLYTYVYTDVIDTPFSMCIQE